MAELYTALGVSRPQLESNSARGVGSNAQIFRPDVPGMNKIRAAAAVASLGVLLFVGGLFVGGGVAQANPPSPDPLAGWPEPLRALVVALSEPLVDVWNFFVDISYLIMLGL
ncbi:hypothetical protein [Rhodococcus spongiicola]|uniref:Uncharacterized protein n=1 Tax=Rhodococcus spongiicola TaxID=2487352 RepID=A0A438B4N2_9NOCA|nr:hypothetical protein [Rhodococcus spongiicola]RVW05955.1 hypothetical protein EF834_00230 [Rhodococcus spongiicola]